MAWNSSIYDWCQKHGFISEMIFCFTFWTNEVKNKSKK